MSQNDPAAKEKNLADLQKLHNEVNQFRMQEFWIASFAFALLGVAIKNLEQFSSYLSFVAIFAIMQIWLHTVIGYRARLTSYLKVRKLSRWEEDYRKFTGPISLGHGKGTKRFVKGSAKTSAFLIFQGIALALFFHLFNHCGFRQDLTFYLCISLAFVPLLIWRFSCRKVWLDYYENIWRKVLNQGDEKIEDVPVQQQLMNFLGWGKSENSRKGDAGSNVEKQSVAQSQAETEETQGEPAGQED